MGNIGTQDQSVASTILFMSTVAKTVTNTTSETSIIGTGNGSTTLPANFFTVGKSLRITIGGVYSTPAITAGSILIKVKLGSTVIASGTASGLLISASSAAFSAMGVITCRTIGASGSVALDAHLDYSVGNNLARFFLDLNNSGSAIAIDTTSSQLFDITATWDTSSTSKIVTTNIVTLEAIG